MNGLSNGTRQSFLEHANKPLWNEMYMASGQSRLSDIQAHAATGTSDKPHLLVCHISFSVVARLSVRH
jgi:hypothetical protein